MPPRKANRTGSGNQNDTGNPTMNHIMQLLQQQAANMVQQQQQHMQHQQERQQQPQGTEPAGTFKSFQTAKPPEFEGSPDPIKARAWLKEIEKAFKLAKVRDEDKADYASYFLKNEANYWWESAKGMEEGEVVSWERFVELFLEKYFPEHVQSQMELDFLKLKQDDKSVAEYEARFVEMARFVNAYVDTDLKKAKRFQQGLRSDIRVGMAALRLRTYAEVVQTAMVIEGEHKLSEKEKEVKKRKVDVGEGSQNQGSQKRKEFPQHRNFGLEAKDITRIDNLIGPYFRTNRTLPDLQFRSVRCVGRIIRKYVISLMLRATSVKKKGIMHMNARTGRFKRTLEVVLNVENMDIRLRIVRTQG